MGSAVYARADAVGDAPAGDGPSVHTPESNASFQSPEAAQPFRRRNALARRYALLLCGVTLVLLLVSGLSQALFGYFESRAHIADVQAVQAQSAVKEISDYLGVIEAELRNTARLPWGSAGFGPEERRREFYRTMQLLPAVADLQVMDSLGRERLFVSRQVEDRIESLRPIEDASALQVSSKAPLRYGRTSHRDDLSPVVRMAVFDGNGAIVATIDLRLLGEVISKLRIGREGLAYIVDAKQTLIAHPRSTEVLRRPELQAFDAVRRASAADWSGGSTIALLDTQDLQGSPVIATAARVEAPGWLLIVEQPRAEALQPVLDALWRTILLFVVGGLVAVVVGIWFANRMAAPIVTLRRATKLIAGGDLESRIQVRSHDEIEDLADDFNSMAVRLQESYASLEAKVTERTVQLSEARDKIARDSAEVAKLNERLVDQVDQLAARKDEAERASAAKTRFLATASHDLRQPMHSISLLVGVLHGRMADSESRLIAEKVQASVSTMEGLFGSLLDLSKLDAGAVRPDIGEFALAGLFWRVEQIWAPQALERGLHLTVRPTDLLVISDDALLERIVGNLVSNAIRYTREGRVLLAARRRGEHCLIQVYDTGPGISPMYREAIFEEFFRIDAPGTAEAKGLGLGLSIVHRGAQILGHGLRVESVVGHGSMFELTVACSARRAGPDAGPDEPKSVADSMSGKFVVVVDDDADNRHALARVLLSWGCHVLMAGSIKDALSQARDHLRVPDLLVTDFQLADNEDGFGVARSLGEHYEQAIPLLIITANTDSGLSARAAALGARLLHKPVGAARLLSTALEILPPEPVPSETV